MKFTIKCEECGEVIIPEHKISEERKANLFGIMDRDTNDQYVMKGDLIIKFDICTKCFQEEFPETDAEFYKDEDLDWDDDILSK